jgi:hypothetical protein
MVKFVHCLSFRLNTILLFSGLILVFNFHKNYLSFTHCLTHLYISRAGYIPLLNRPDNALMNVYTLFWFLVVEIIIEPEIFLMLIKYKNNQTNGLTTFSLMLYKGSLYLFSQAKANLIINETPENLSSGNYVIYLIALPLIRSQRFLLVRISISRWFAYILLYCLDRLGIFIITNVIHWWKVLKTNTLLLQFNCALFIGVVMLR